MPLHPSPGALAWRSTMDQSGNNQLLLRASQSGPPGYNGYTGQHAAADRMRELLARTVQDHIVEERTTAAALQDIRQRLNDLDDASAAGIAASLDGLAASLGTLDSKLTARLERLDERLDDQYDRVRALESTLKEQPVSLEEAVAKGVEASGADIMARIASLEDTVLTLAEALLRPAAMRLGPAHSHCHLPGDDPPYPPVQTQWQKAPLDWACSLPLNSSWRLAGDVECHPVDLADLVGDTGRDPREHLVGQPRPVRRHRVLAGHRPEHVRVAIGPAVALDADRAHVGQQHHRALPDRLVQARRGHLGPGDRVRLAQHG